MGKCTKTGDIEGSRYAVSSQRWGDQPASSLLQAQSRKRTFQALLPWLAWPVHLHCIPSWSLWSPLRAAPPWSLPFGNQTEVLHTAHSGPLAQHSPQHPAPAAPSTARRSHLSRVVGPPLPLLPHHSPSNSSSLYSIHFSALPIRLFTWTLLGLSLDLAFSPSTNQFRSTTRLDTLCPRGASRLRRPESCIISNLFPVVTTATIFMRPRSCRFLPTRE